jgi:hypothetical protein
MSEMKVVPPKSLSIEGYTADELLALPSEMLDAYLLADEPILFRMGTAEILAKFELLEGTLAVELAHIDGGGEGVLPALWSTIERYAKKKGAQEVEWIVHAISCARPNMKLRRVLEKRGFVIRETSRGMAYHQLTTIS